MKPTTVRNLKAGVYRKPLFVLTALLLTQSLRAEVLYYEGFGDENGVNNVRDHWTLQTGEFFVGSDDLSIEGLESSPNSLVLQRDGVCVSPLENDFPGVVYGSFRVRPEKVAKDSTINFSVFDSDTVDYNVNDSRIGLILKGYRNPLGGVVANGKKKRIKEGGELEIGQINLILFKLVDKPGKPGKLTFWICLPNQVNEMIAEGFSEDYLMEAQIGSGDDQVAQRVSVKIPAGKQPVLQDGAFLYLASRFGSISAFDEIRISSSSLSEAAGLPSEQ